MSNLTKHNHESGSIIVAVGNSVLSILLMAIYAPCVYVILRNENFYCLASYKFILLMALFDMMQLVCLGPVSAVYQMTTGLILESTEVWGAIGFVGWFGYQATIALLSIERFFKVWRADYWKRLYDGCVIYLWLAAPVIYSTILFAVLLGNSHHAYYDVTLFSWYYDEVPSLAFIQITDIVGGIIAAVIMTIVYVSIFIRFYNMKQSTSDGSSKHERQILYQSFTASSMLLAVVVTWHGVPALTTNKWALWICHLIWIANSGVNGLVYMTFNKSLRDAVRETYATMKIRLVGTEPPTVVTVQPANHINISVTQF